MRSTQQSEGGETGGVEHAAGSVAGAARARHGLRIAGKGASRLLVVLTLLALVAGGGWLVTKAATPPATTTTSTIPGLNIKAAKVEPGSVAPVEAAPAGGRAPAGEAEQPPEQESASQPVSTRELLTRWAERAEPVVGIPSRALVAYGSAELAMRAAQPNCRLSWATLAGIGRIESNHGRYGGAVLQPNGFPSKPIIGVPLDGSPGVEAISDSDNGYYDGDPVHDRAVGPMQFIPTTWARWASDGNGDGRGNPQQIDDAALAAARYLCAGGRDMGTAQGWWQGILSYNRSTEYAKKVFGLAETYAKRARTLSAG